jgi:hypothetical protein
MFFTLICKLKCGTAEIEALVTDVFSYFVAKAFCRQFKFLELMRHVKTILFSLRRSDMNGTGWNKDFYVKVCITFYFLERV